MSRITMLSPTLLSALLGLGALLAWSATVAEESADKAAPRVYEMRTYIAHDGKFEDLHKRFREHTVKLFEKHGMTNVGYWVPAEGPDSKTTLVYLLSYPSREAREKSWKAFLDDPEWKQVYAESHKNGPLVAKVISQFLSPTDYSPLK